MPINATRFSPFSTLLLYPLNRRGSITNLAPSRSSFPISLKEHPSQLKPSATTAGSSTRLNKLDAQGLATLTHLGSLPTVWLPPGGFRDERELHHTRMALSKVRTALKNRIHATMAKYALNTSAYSDIFVGKGRAWLDRTIQKLPTETGRCVHQELELLDATMLQISVLEKRIKESIELTPNMQRLKTLPGVGNILAIVIEREVGTVDRPPAAGHLAAYAGVVPKIHSSGGKTRYCRMRTQANNYLKWAFIEAANVVVAHRHHASWREKKVTQVFERICRRKGHATAWVLSLDI